MFMDFDLSRITITWSNTAKKETLQKSVQYVQSQQLKHQNNVNDYFIVNFEHMYNTFF